MKLLNVALLFLRMATLVLCEDIDRGYPGGFFKYGDRNNDGTIQQSEIDANLNMGWIKDWYLITKNLTEINRDMKMTAEQFNSFIIGILRVTSKHLSLFAFHRINVCNNIIHTFVSGYFLISPIRSIALQDTHRS